MAGEIFIIGDGAGAIFNAGVTGANVSNTQTVTAADATVVAGKAATMGRVKVPTGKKIVVRSAGVTNASGAVVATVKAQAYDATADAELCATTASAEAFTTANEAAAGKVVLFRLVNGSAAVVVASAFVTYSIIDA